MNKKRTAINNQAGHTSGINKPPPQRIFFSL
jgi:hypothetical protein